LLGSYRARSMNDILATERRLFNNQKLQECMHIKHWDRSEYSFWPCLDGILSRFERHIQEQLDYLPSRRNVYSTRRIYICGKLFGDSVRDDQISDYDWVLEDDRGQSEDY